MVIAEKDPTEVSASVGEDGCVEVEGFVGTFDADVCDGVGAVERCEVIG